MRMVSKGVKIIIADYAWNGTKKMIIFFFFLITIKTLPFSMIHISFNKNYFIGRNIIIST